jgi:hypothetical protein
VKPPHSSFLCMCLDGFPFRRVPIRHHQVSLSPRVNGRLRLTLRNPVKTVSDLPYPKNLNSLADYRERKRRLCSPYRKPTLENFTRFSVSRVQERHITMTFFESKFDINLRYTTSTSEGANIRL